MRIIAYNKLGNKEYITYRDKDSKKVRQKSKYPGVLVNREKKEFNKLIEKLIERLVFYFGDQNRIYEFLKRQSL